MKTWLIFACCLALFSCARFRAVPYVPNPNVSEPAKVMERVLKSQPPAYAFNVPFEVFFNSDCIEMRTIYPGAPGENRYAICYVNIGKVVLNKTQLWQVEILDRSGYYLYNVYSFEESEAKLFIDALYTVMGKQPTN